MKNFIVYGLILTLFSCAESKTDYDPFSRLPILGEKDIVGTDTTYHTIPEFTFTNQYGEEITRSTFENAVYIVDYFFTSCPTICPKVKDQEFRVFEKYKDRKDVYLLSVTVDPKYDTVERLAWYVDKLEIPKSNWHLVTGDKDFIYEVADDFFHIAQEDPEAEGGFNHDGRLILIDKNNRIRSFCDGLDEKDVDRFMLDIDKLLNEK